MFKAAEREALTDFMKYFTADLARCCDYCDVSRFVVVAKLKDSKRKLTEREAVAVKAYLRALNKEFKSWCDGYSVNPDSIRTNIDKMGVAK